MLSQINARWKLPSVSFPLDFSTNFESNITSFDIDWLLNKLEYEVNQSKIDIDLIRNETQIFLQKELPQDRVKRGAHVGALAMAGIGLFGSGVVMGSSGGCGLAGVFDTCQDEAKTNAANIEHLGTITQLLTTHIAKLTSMSYDKFFVVKKQA